MQTKSLKVDSIVDGTTNIGMSKCPWVNEVCTCRHMSFEIGWMDAVFTSVDATKKSNREV